MGVGVGIGDALGGKVLDVLVPGGAYDPVTKAGWNASPNRGVWKYVNRSATPPAGITGVAIKDLSQKLPGLVQVIVRGRRGAYPIAPAMLPLTGLLILDPPTAEMGQCGQASFVGPSPACSTGGRTVRCK